MEIFFTDYHQLAALSSDEHGLVESLRHAGVPDRMPFILASDGSYDLQLNRFLRELPHNGVRSWHSWKSYALDLLTWCRFLEERRDTTVWKATRSDLIAYHQIRRGVLPLLPSTTVLDHSIAAPLSAASWNRAVAALDKFYQWAHAEGYIQVLPFTYREASYMSVSVMLDQADRQTGSDRALGLVDFTLYPPHLDHPSMPEASLANLERWAAGVDMPVYLLDDQTAIQVVDGVVKVVSEGHWKRFTP